jgi:tetratricopeptide (TPR) repeat protein
LGMVYAEADSIGRADSIFTALLNAGDSSIIDYYYAGRIALLSKDYERAKGYFIKLTISDGSIVDGWLNLGLVYRLQDSTALEIKTYEDGLPHSNNVDDSVALLFNLGVALEENSQYENAITTFEKIIELSPQNSQALNYLGYMLADRGTRLEYALELIKKALEIMPDNGAYIDSYGWVLYKKGDYSKALTELLRAYAIISDDPVISEHVGYAYEALGDMENARKYWSKALELDPNNEGLKEKLGR